MKQSNSALKQMPVASKEFTTGTAADKLVTAIRGALPILQKLSAVLDVYGSEENARDLRGAIGLLKGAVPAEESVGKFDFLVAERFSVKRLRVAQLLLLGFEGSSWCRIVGDTEPPEIVFRVDEKQVFEHLDYPLNEGGSVDIAAFERSAVFQLNFNSIVRGLGTLAIEYPRHFADFLNGAEDRITGTMFLQCCLWGQVIYD